MDKSSPLIWGVPFRKINITLLLCFLLVGLSVLLLLSQQVSRGLHINTDLRSLLPTSAGHDLQQLAADRLLDLGGNHTVLMVAAEDVATVKLAATSIVQGLESSDYWRVSQRASDDAQFQQLVGVLQKYRFQLLSEEQRGQLQQADFESLAAQALYQLYQPSGWMRVVPPSDDPLNLFAGWLTDQQKNLAGLDIEDGFLLTSEADDLGSWYGIVLVELLVDPFALDTQQPAVNEISTLFSTLPATITPFRSGILFHAAEAAARAADEVRVISLGSVIGIVLLYLLTFRSLRPLIFSLCAIFCGSVVALTVVHAVFSEVHLITLVFGASLIGVSVDYALHFLSRLYHVQSAMLGNGDAKGYITPVQAIVSVFPSITLALATTVVGYLCLTQSDMRGLYQIALFSIVGLITAWLFVVVVFPRVFTQQPINRYRWLVVLCSINMKFWSALNKRKIIYTLWLILPLLVIYSVMALQFSKDIRTLHRASLPLLNEAKAVQKNLNAFAPNQFFVVFGKTPQAVLEIEEAFQASLNDLVSEGSIRSFDKVSNYLPSMNRQRENYRLLKNRAYDVAGGVEHFMQHIGVETKSITKHRSDFLAAEEHLLSLPAWQAVAPEAVRSLWLGRVPEVTEERFASMITLVGIKDTSALQRAASFSEQVIFVDRVEDISQGLVEHSRQAALFLLAAYGVIAMLLLLRYRQASALLLVLIPLLSSVVVLVLLGSSGAAISLFHIFGLFLVLGLGIDYGLFIREAAASSLAGGACWVAINLSAITSCLSFGLMSFSSTPMVSAFGVTVLIGSVCNLLLVPLITVIAGSAWSDCAQ